MLAKYSSEHTFLMEVGLEIGQGDRQIIAADILDPGILARHDPATPGPLLAAWL